MSTHHKNPYIIDATDIDHLTALNVTQPGGAGNPYVLTLTAVLGSNAAPSLDGLKPFKFAIDGALPRVLAADGTEIDG